VVQNEIESITEQECIDYAYNLVINRTYVGYQGEISTVYGQLQGNLGYKIEPAPDEWDRFYNVDFFIKINSSYIGLQIKPAGSTSHIPQIFKERSLQEVTHKKFQQKYGGQVFYVISIKSGNRKVIHNTDVIDSIKKEIKRLKQLK